MRIDEELAGEDQGVCVLVQIDEKKSRIRTGCGQRLKQRASSPWSKLAPIARGRRGEGQPIATLGSQRAQHHDSHQRGGEELAELRVRTANKAD